MALEIKLGHDLRLPQQLVMTPQLQHAIEILQISLPELEAVVLKPLDQSVVETAARAKKSKKSR
jgi:DNA-directed RNA polymerase specialized sigma54-like protein